MCACARRYVPIGREECKRFALTHRKEHPVALEPANGARLEVRYERQLAADKQRGVGNICGNTGDDLARTWGPIIPDLAEINQKTQEFVGIRYALGRSDCADFHFYLRKLVDGDAWLIHGWCGRDNW